MFRIAVCDDNDAVCSAIENTIDGFFKTESIHYEIDSFQSGEELLEELNDHVKYDLIYLDIELAQLNGVAVGRYIRENLLDDYTQIAFISAKPSYVFCFLSLIITPIIAKIFGGLFLNGMPLAVLVILMGTPAGALLPSFVESYGKSAKMASQYVFMSTLLSLITLPLVAEFLCKS